MYRKRLVVYVDEEMQKALKHKVVDDDTTLTALVKKLLLAYFKPAVIMPFCLVSIGFVIILQCVTFHLIRDSFL